MTVHGLRPEFQPSNLSAENQTQNKKPEVIKPSTGEHEGIPSIHKKNIDTTYLGQNFDKMS